ncbi:MAG: tetratricopeptide repeat protein, partial [Cytophagales bacterium]|nr:tetratricopeptide repeat protein [Cytophaga sp.]
YYDDLEDYENAGAYYDSTASTFDKTDKRYPLIQKRNKILDNFVLHIKTIKVQDSLLRIAAMDTVSRNRLIDTLIAQEQAAYIKEQLALRKKKNQEEQVTINTDKFNNLDPSSASWYFNNQKAIQEGLNDFTRNWGKRKLEDHWRRSKKEAVIEFSQDSLADDSLNATNSASAKNDGIEPLKVDRNKYLKDLPFTDEEKAAANTKIEDAMFQVASIYNHQLDETDRAIRTYEQILKRYPETLYEPEILYNLYLIYKERKNKKYDTYKNTLFDKYPNSIYTKLIKNPNYYRDNRIANKQADEHYKAVFDLYKSGAYKASDSTASVLLIQYPDSEITDKLTYIKLLCKLKIDGPSAELVLKLKQFKASYPDSPLVPSAIELIATIEKIKPDVIPKSQ